MRTPALIATLVLLASAALADEAVLSDGTALSGRVVARSADGAIELQPATGGAPRRLARDEVRELRETPSAGYVRFVEYAPGWSRLEVLSRTLADASGRRVTLAGAVHIADLSFYARVQRILDGHDVVLFEGVGAENGGDDLSRIELPDASERARELARPFQRRKRRAADDELARLDLLTAMQLRMGESLDLAFQIDGVDYSHSWWVAADVSVEELRRLFDERERSIVGDMLGGGASARQQQAANAIVLKALGEAATSLFTGKPLKIIWKESFARLLAEQMTGFSPEREGKPESVMQEVIVVGRNKVVDRKLAEVLRAPGVRSVAIFYGAGHYGDLERRVRAQGFTTVAEERWVPAWDIRSEARSIFGAPRPLPAPVAPPAKRQEPTLF